MSKTLVAALALSLAMPALGQTAKARIAAAKKAERSKNYKKMLSEYQAACASEPGPECQLGIGDAYAKLGDRANARKAYDLLINDPFAPPNMVAKAKGAQNRLDSGALPSLDLPATADLPSLDLPGPAAPKKKKKTLAAAPLEMPPLDLAPPPAAKKTAKKKKKTTLAASLDLPPMDVPPAKKTKKAAPPSLDMPPLDLPATAEPEKVASVDAPPAAEPSAPEAEPTKTEEPPAVATSEPALPDLPPPEPKPAKKPKPIAAAPSAPSKPTATASLPGKEPVAHEALVAQAPAERPTPAGRGTVRMLAWATTGVAVLSLAGGVMAYTKAGSSASELHQSVRSGAAQQRLIDQQKLNKSLSAVGLLGGVVAGGLGAILFTF